MINSSECETCRECCCYVDYKGYQFTQEEMQKYFSFPKHLCEIFFQWNPRDSKYTIGDYCKNYCNNRCSIYDSFLFPFACAAYPFFLVTATRGETRLTIDKNCRKWRSFLPMANQITPLIVAYLEKGKPIDIFPEKDLKRMGYKLYLIEKRVQFP